MLTDVERKSIYVTLLWLYMYHAVAQTLSTPSSWQVRYLVLDDVWLTNMSQGRTSNLSRESREALAFEAASAFPVNEIDPRQLPTCKSLLSSRHARWLILRTEKG